MPNWLAWRGGRPASYQNTITIVIAFIILGFIYFNLLHGDAVFLGSHYKPRMDSFAIITLSALCMGLALLFGGALLNKSGAGRADAFSSQSYNTGTVIGVPSRVKRFRTAARTCNSAT